MTDAQTRKSLRNAARFALYSSLVITGALFALAYPLIDRRLASAGDQSWHEIDYASLPEVRRLQDLIRIDTTAETGREIDAALYLEEVLRGEGIEARVERLPDGRANLWAIIEGRRPEALVLHSHLDTDPVHEPERWSHPPFSATIELPWIVGRGAFDMKSVTVAQLEAFLSVQRRMLETGSPPKRSLILLATSSEETGSHLGVRHILARYPELARRFWSVLTEGGVVEATDVDTIKYWGTTFVQKQYLRIWACSWQRERLEALVEDIYERGQLGRPRLTTEALDFLRVYGPTRQEVSVKSILANPEVVLRDQRSFQFLPFYLQALFRDEIHPFPIEPNPGGGFRVRLSLHLLPGSDHRAALELYLPNWLTHGIHLTMEGPIGANHGSAIDHPSFEILERTLKERYQTAAVGPYFVTRSASDSRFFRQLGIPSYGFTPFLAMTTETTGIGNADERLALPAFVEGVDLYEEVVRNVLKEEAR